MRILITNDDGYSAPGIRALASEARSRGHECFVIAPDRCYSGSSHSMTFRKYFYVDSLDGGAGHDYLVRGTPCDCVKFGITAIGISFDLVLSGINNEPNLGTDVVYSGTVQAAIEAAINGVNGIALSADPEMDSDYELAAKLFFERLPRIYLKMNTEALNINLQSNLESEWRCAHLGISKFTDYYESKEAEREGVPTRLMGDFLMLERNDAESDVRLYKEGGFHTITPMRIDQTAYDRLNAWKEL